MFGHQLSLALALFSSIALQQVAAHGYCVKFGVAGKTYAGFNPTWEGGPSILGPTPQRPADNVNTEWADYTTEQIATGSVKTSEVGTQQLTAPAKAGDKITIWYDQWPQPHSGPIMRYMANCGGSCDGVPAGDLDWFKIDEEGYSNGQWPNDKLLPSNKWAQSFNLPTDLPAGDYLLANHMLAMHNVGEPQFYPVAFQIKLESSGTVDPQPKGKFPDIYLNGPQDFTTWNIYEANNANFKLPGIPVYSGGSGAVTAAPATTGRAPPVIENPDDGAVTVPGKAKPTSTKTPAAGNKDSTTIQQIPDEDAVQASGQATPTATKTPAGDDKEKKPSRPKTESIASDQEQAVAPPPKKPGTTSEDTTLATPTAPPQAGKPPGGAGGGGTTVTVTIYADEPTPTSMDSATPIKYEGEMHAWNVISEKEGAEDESSVVVSSPANAEKKPSNGRKAGATDSAGPGIETQVEPSVTGETERTSSAHSDQHSGKKQGSPLEVPCPMGDEETSAVPEEEPSVVVPSPPGAKQEPADGTKAGATNDNVPESETPIEASDSSETATISSGLEGGDAGKEQGSPLQEPCPMNDEDAADGSSVWEGTGDETIEPSGTDPNSDTDVPINNAMFVSAKVPILEPVQGEPATSALHAEKQSMEEAPANPSAALGASGEEALKDAASDDKFKVDLSSADSGSPGYVETPPFDMSHCILKFDAATDEYALEKRRSRIRARARTGHTHGSDDSVTPTNPELPPCATYTLEKEVE